MAALWKWSALAAALYGLVAVAAIFGPPRALNHPPPPPGLGGKPGQSGSLRGSIDFNEPVPEFRSTAPSITEVVKAADGDSVLRWTFPSFQREASALIIPLAGGPGLRQLQFSATASQPLTVLLMLTEDDGSSYMLEAGIGTEESTLRLGLQDFERFPASTDENERLDPEQIRELSLLHKGVRTAAGQEAVRLRLELDDLGLS